MLRAALGEELGNGSTACAVDLTSAAAMDEAADFIKRYSDCLDILVNNAAVSPTPKALSKASLDEGRFVMETNTLSPIKLAQLLLPLIQQSDSGHIINVTSEMGSHREILSEDYMNA